uniref:NADH-ubiquinone oxidoreductase chain 2 n=1 Tax=Camaena cicatricosa TaxID=1550735 RepID=A0A0A0QNJ5_CAMCI|nr:NADH dehydrogenase subunit 2 [Camaena cicatricosa]AIS20801.1 NADH dehydrogenase subunit 2 [Camaena cicatricosa]
MGVTLTWLVLSGSMFLGLTVSNYIIMIMLMEVSLFAFIFLVDSNRLPHTMMACIKYFLVQTIGSILLFSSIMFITYNEQAMYLLSLPGILLKLGVFPMHFWVLPVNKELSYLLIGVVGSPLKLLPLWYFNNMYTYIVLSISYLILLLSTVSMIIGMINGLVSSSIRTMLGASSISHSGWFLLSVLSLDVIAYFLLYTLSFLMVIASLFYSTTWLTTISLLSLSGLPPFSVFMGKLLVIYHLMAFTSTYVYLMVALLSVIASLYYYLKFAFYFYLTMKKMYTFLMGAFFFILNSCCVLYVLS